MKTNASITLYHNRYDEVSGTDKWDRYPIDKVTWNGGKGVSFNKGYERANDVTIWAFYKDNPKLADIPIDFGDIVVKGISSQKITKQSDLTMENYNIQTIIDNNYTNDRVNHIKIGAK